MADEPKEVYLDVSLGQGRINMNEKQASGKISNGFGGTNLSLRLIQFIQLFYAKIQVYPKLPCQNAQIYSRHTGTFVKVWVSPIVKILRSAPKNIVES